MYQAWQWPIVGTETAYGQTAAAPTVAGTASTPATTVTWPAVPTYGQYAVPSAVQPQWGAWPTAGQYGYTPGMAVNPQATGSFPAGWSGSSTQSQPSVVTPTTTYGQATTSEQSTTNTSQPPPLSKSSEGGGSKDTTEEEKLNQLRAQAQQWTNQQQQQQNSAWPLPPAVTAAAAAMSGSLTTAAMSMPPPTQAGVQWPQASWNQATWNASAWPQQQQQWPQTWMQQQQQPPPPPAADPKPNAPTSKVEEPNKESNQGTTQVLAAVDTHEITEKLAALDKEEEEFDRQFQEWEKQFGSWKEQNANHPDKDAFSSYEKQWQEWREQLLQNKEEMHKKKETLQGELKAKTEEAKMAADQKSTSNQGATPFATMVTTAQSIPGLDIQDSKLAAEPVSTAPVPAQPPYFPNTTQPQLGVPPQPYMYMPPQPFMFPPTVPPPPTQMPPQVPFPYSTVPAPPPPVVGTNNCPPSSSHEIPTTADQQPLIDQRPPSMDHRPPLMDRPPLLDQRPPLMDRPPPMDKRPPLMDCPPPMDQRLPRMDQHHPQMDQRPPPMDQRPPLLDQPLRPMDQHPPLMDQCNPPMDRRPPLMDQPPRPMDMRPPPQKRPLLSTPPVGGLLPPPGNNFENRPMDFNQMKENAQDMPPGPDRGMEHFDDPGAFVEGMEEPPFQEEWGFNEQNPGMNFPSGRGRGRGRSRGRPSRWSDANDFEPPYGDDSQPPMGFKGDAHPPPDFEGSFNDGSNFDGNVNPQRNFGRAAGGNFEAPMDPGRNFPGDMNPERRFEGGMKRPNEFEGGMKGPNDFEGGMKRPNDFEGGMKGPNDFEGGMKRPNDFGGGMKRPNDFEGGMQPPRNFEGGMQPPRNFEGGMNPPRNFEGMPPGRGFDGNGQRPFPPNMPNMGGPRNLGDNMNAPNRFENMPPRDFDGRPARKFDGPQLDNKRDRFGNQVNKIPDPDAFNPDACLISSKFPPDPPVEEPNFEEGFGGDNQESRFPPHGGNQFPPRNFDEDMRGNDRMLPEEGQFPMEDNRFGRRNVPFDGPPFGDNFNRRPPPFDEQGPFPDEPFHDMEAPPRMRNDRFQRGPMNREPFLEDERGMRPMRNRPFPPDFPPDDRFPFGFPDERGPPRFMREPGMEPFGKPNFDPDGRPFRDERPIQFNSIDYTHKAAGHVIGEEFGHKYDAFDQQFGEDLINYRAVFDYAHRRDGSPPRDRDRNVWDRNAVPGEFFKEPVRDRDQDKDKNKPRDRERERDRDRNRDRGRGRETERDRERDRNRDRSREKERTDHRDKEDKRDKDRDERNEKTDRDLRGRGKEGNERRHRWDRDDNARNGGREKSPDNSSQKKTNNDRNRENKPFVPSQVPPPDIFKTESSNESVLIKDLLYPPNRFNRPKQLVIILRGIPGSGKTYVAKLIKDKEAEHGGSAPRILSLDDYFMAESEVNAVDPETGKKIKKKEFKYEYEACMEESYRSSLLRSFKKTIDDRFFLFVVVDAVNNETKHYEPMWSYAKQRGFQVYIAEMENNDPTVCHKKNVHNRSLDDLKKMKNRWDSKPKHFLSLDIRALLQDVAIPEVEMEDLVTSDEKKGEDKSNDDVKALMPFHVPSRWEKLEATEEKLDQLDGLRTSKKKQIKMEDYLQLPDDYENRQCEPGKKRVRWADLEQHKEQDRIRAIGFVVGQTDWSKMTDPSQADRALTKTKYI